MQRAVKRIECEYVPNRRELLAMGRSSAATAAGTTNSRVDKSLARCGICGHGLWRIRGNHLEGAIDEGVKGWRVVDGVLQPTSYHQRHRQRARTRLSDEISRVGRQMDDMSARLAVRRAALQQEFTAADEAMARLNSQKSSLSSISSDLFSSNF